MRKKRVYLAGPMDFCSEFESTFWREYVKAMWPHYDFVDPHDFEQGAEIFQPQHQHDLPPQTIVDEKRAIERSDFLVAYPWRVSAGTSMEIMFASMQPYCRVVVIQDPLIGKLSSWITFHADYVAASFKDAFEWIDQQIDLQDPLEKDVHELYHKTIPVSAIGDKPKTSCEMPHSGGKYQCACHMQMGNDYWFLPDNACLFKKG